MFEQIFLPRAVPVLSHLDEPGGNALNVPCYMWFDVMPSVALADDPDQDSLHAAMLATMEQIVELDHLACREAAPHGLDHWRAGYPRQVAAIVDRYLDRARGRRSELATYARAARCGCVQ